MYLLWPSFAPYDTLYPLWYSVPSMAFCPLYGTMFPLWPSLSSTALCSLYGPLFTLQTLSFLRHSVSSTALCPPLGPSVLSYNPQSPLWPSTLSVLSTLSIPATPSTVIKYCTSPIDLLMWKTDGKTAKQVKWSLLFPKMFCKTRFIKTPRLWHSILHKQ